MAKLFQITLPDGMSNVKLNSQGNATVQYTVKNVSARPIDGRAVLVSLPQTKPPSGVVEKKWATIEGKTDRHFDVDREETFTVKIAVPQKSPPGNYTFRLDTVWVDQTDQGDAGGVVAFSVATGTEPTKKFPLWIIPLIVVVLIGIGVGVWFAVRGGGPKVPNVVAKPLSDAIAEIVAAGFTPDPNPQMAEGKPEDSGNVISTDPPAGTRAAKGETVHLTVGGEMIEVPMLIGHPYQEASGLLDKLVPGEVKTVPNPNFAGGVVTDQNPRAGQKVKSGSAVNMQVTPQTIPVPNVVGQPLGSAILTLKGFTVNSFSGDSTKNVTSQIPAPGTPSPVGSNVSLAFPPPPGGCYLRTCMVVGPLAVQSAYFSARLTREVRKRQGPPPQ